jgi:SAM-dependent methyltransferase
MNCPFCHNSKYHTYYSYTKQSIIDAYINDPLFSENGEDGVDVSSDLGSINSNIDLLECDNCSLRYFDPPLTGSSSFYRKLQKYHWYYKEGGDDKSEFSFVKEHYLTDSDSVLELGCGDAYFKNYVKGNYTGVDPFSQNPCVLKDTVESYAEKNIQHDIVCAFQTIEHVADPKSFVANAVRCTKLNGLLIISAPSEDSFLGYVRNFSLNLPPHHVTRWTDKSLKFLAEQFDLKLIDLYHEPMIDYHRKLLMGDFYDLMDPDKIIDYNLGHTVIAVYQNFSIR